MRHPPLRLVHSNTLIAPARSRSHNSASSSASSRRSQIPPSLLQNLNALSAANPSAIGLIDVFVAQLLSSANDRLRGSLRASESHEP